MTGVTVASLRKAYGSLTVLRDIDLEVRDGEFTVLLVLRLRQIDAALSHCRAG